MSLDSSQMAVAEVPEEDLLSAPPFATGSIQSNAAHAARDASEPACQLLEQYSTLLGLPLACVKTRTGEVVGHTEGEWLRFVPVDTVRQLARSGTGPKVSLLPSGILYFTLPLPAFRGASVAAAGYVLSRSGTRPADLVMAAAECGWSQDQFDLWLAQLPYCQPEVFQRHLAFVAGQIKQDTQIAEQRREFDNMASQLEYTYEEISLLHSLTQNMQLSRAPRELAMLSLERLGCVIQAEGHVVLLDEKRGRSALLVEGKVPFDAAGLTRLVARFDDNEWSRPLVKNFIEGSLLGAEFPGLKNFILVPIAERNHRFGWLCSCNLADGQEFGTVQASLLASVASILGTHGRNLDLYRQHEELLLSFVRSLVSSLDAKDPYTRGHSERVALVARAIGTELKLPEEDLRDIYLSGLLHDIGKIGIDDQILRKPAPLTPEEFEQVKKHPVIGYQIISGLKNLRRVIPGVRHHHEAWSGKGYPDGLRGEEIPLMARILAVADSYDAMGSDRPYRKGMPLEKLETILRDGAGIHWDPQVVEAYFRSRLTVKSICENYCPSNFDLLEQSTGDDAGISTPLDSDSIRAALSAVSEPPK